MFDYAGVDCPYPGLRPFEPYEGEIFYGREGHTDQLLETLHRERFLAVVGPSGCGKSSLVRAGLLPALAGGRLGTGSHWRLALLRPGSQPLLALAQALIGRHALGPELLGIPPKASEVQPSPMIPATVEQATADAALIAADLRCGPQGFERVLGHAQANRLSTSEPKRGQLGAESERPIPTLNLLILVDQFEEIFTYRGAGPDPTEAAQFVELLLSACGAKNGPKHESLPGSIRVVVVLTMRTDFLGHCDEFRDLPEAINRAIYLTPRLRKDELHAAIVSPAQSFGGDVDAAFVESTIGSAEIANDQLPLVQHALGRWWRAAVHASPERPIIDQRSMRGADGLREVLNLHADSVYESLTADERTACEVLFRAITTGSEGGDAVRRPQRLADIAQWGEVSQDSLLKVVAAFAAPEVSFLHHGVTLNGDSMIDLTHESLMRHWVRLKNWVEIESRRGEGWRRWRSRAVEHSVGEGELLVGGDLARANDWWNPGATASAKSTWQPSAQWALRYSPEASTEQSAATQLEELRAYLIASNNAGRRAQKARRWLVGLILVLLAVGLVGSCSSLLTAQRALKLESANLRIAKEAAVDGLIAAAERQLRQGNADLSALLGINALAARTNSDAAKSTLLLALGELYTRFTLAGHSKPVRHLTSSADGMILVTAGEDGAVLFWRASDGKQVGALPKRTTAVVGLGTFQDGETLAVGYADGTVLFWDSRSMKGVRELKAESPIGGLAGSADGRAVTWSASSGRVQVWNQDSDSPTADFDTGPRPINDAVFLRSGNLIATGHSDGIVRLWDARGSHVRSLSAHVGPVRRVYQSPDGKTLLSTSSDFTARTWNLLTGHVCPFPGNKGPVTSAAFSPDSKRIATAGSDSTARVWNVSDCKLSVDLRGHRDAINFVSFSRDGRRIVTAGADFSAKVWNADHGTLVSDLKGHTQAVRVAMFVGTGQSVLTGSDDGSARLWSIEKGDAIASFGGFRDKAVDIAQGAAGNEVVALLSDGRLRRWPLEGRGADLGPPLVQGSQAATLSADGMTAVMVGRVAKGGAIGLVFWQTESGQLLHAHRLEPARSYAVSASDDGSTVAVGSSDKRVRVFRSRSFSSSTYAIKTDGTVRGVAISGDGKRIAATLSDHAVIVLDTATGQEICALRDQKWPFSMAHLNKDGSMAVAAGADGTSVVWKLEGSDAQGCQAIGTLHQAGLGSRQAVTSLRFNHNGSLLAVGNSDGSIKVWSAKEWLQVAELKGHQSAISTLRFAADGESLFSAASDRLVRQWSIARLNWPSDKLLPFARDRLVNLNFRAAAIDCKRYFSVHFDPGSDIFCAGSR